MRACVQRGHPGPYQVQAAVNAVHSLAPSFDSTDWRAILTLYDQLYALTPTPVVALNRAVALAEVRGPAAGLAAVDDLRSPALDSYYLFHAARANLLRRLGRGEEAAAAYDVARSLTANPVEQAFLDAQHARSSRQALTDDKGRVALIRTITLTWLFSGLRSEEISRTALAEPIQGRDL